MAVGCVKNDDSIANMEAKPYKSAHEKKRIFPTNDQLKDEVLRQAKLFELKREPQPKGWNAARVREWLSTNPITNKVDIRYLQKEERDLRAKNLHLAANERDEQVEQRQTEVSW
jgi:hypothetical protein